MPVIVAFVVVVIDETAKEDDENPLNDEQSDSHVLILEGHFSALMPPDSFWVL